MHGMSFYILLLSIFEFTKSTEIGTNNYNLEESNMINSNSIKSVSISKSTILNSPKRKLDDTSEDFSTLNKSGNNKKKKTKVIRHKLKVEDIPIVDIKKIYYLNRNLKSIGDLGLQLEKHHLVSLIHSNEECTNVFLKITNIFKTIYENYCTFASITNIDYKQLDYSKSLLTIEELDDRCSKLIDSHNIINPFIPRWNKIFVIPDYNVHYSHIGGEERLTRSNLKNLYLSIANHVKKFTLKDLTTQLLHKISTNSIKLAEIKSIVLSIFYMYPINLTPLNGQVNIHELKCFIGKVITLIDMANRILEENAKIRKDIMLKKIDELLKRALKYFLYRSSNHKYFNASYTYINNNIATHSNPNIPFKLNDFLFLNFCVRNHGDVVKNFIKPVKILQTKMEEFKKLPYYYLIKALNRMDKLGQFIIENTKKIHDDEQKKEVNMNI